MRVLPHPLAVVLPNDLIGNVVVNQDQVEIAHTEQHIAFSAKTVDIPIQNGGYLVRLHFAEIAQNGAGKRLFDVNIEGGNKELANFDIFKEAGGMNRAIVREFDAQVTDGTMNIQFIRQLENAKISAIEILPVSGGTPAADKAAPAAPNALNATASQSGVALDWADNPEPDVAGYEVYRGDAAGGPFARLNGATLAVGSQYNDATAQMGSVGAVPRLLRSIPLRHRIRPRA